MKRENIFLKARKKLNLSRKDVCDLIEKKNLGAMSEDRLERIESEKIRVYPEDVLCLMRAYEAPELCNSFCANQCPLGMEFVPEIQVMDLERIVLRTISSMNAVKEKQDRLIDIAEDGIIKDEELKDFISIQNELEEIADTVASLQFWVQKMITEGKIDVRKYWELTEE